MVDRALDREMTVRTLLSAALAACFIAFLGVLALGGGSAKALQVYAYTASTTSSQAGGHPDLGISYAGESRENPQLFQDCQCNEPKHIRISTPAGFIGNPHATPQCAAADFARNLCPADSQVGSISALANIGGGYDFNVSDEPIYNSLPRSTQAGLLSMSLLPQLFGVPLYTILEARTGGDYGLNANTDGIEAEISVEAFNLTLWGVPADASHDAHRVQNNITQARPWPSNSPLTPFLQNPTACSGSLTSTVTVTGYDGSVNSASSPWPATTGCDQLTFGPSLSAKPTTTEADSASGVDIDLTVPQPLSPNFPSPSEIKAATITLPVGFSINPNAADGKTSCADVAANIGTGSTAAADCPEFAKIGTDTIDSSALPAPIPGAIYLGDPQPGNRYRIFLTADGFNTHVKLAGSVHPDPVTGQLVTSFDNLPQAPLTEFNLHFFGAERGLLATPTQCGTYPVVSTFTPWDEALPSQTSTQFFTIDSGPGGTPCPGAIRSFNPSFAATSVGNTAGAHSPFMIDLTRNDGDQNLAALDVSTPPGFAATLKGVPYCPDSALTAVMDSSYSGLAEQASPSCPAASQIGTAVAGAGAGTHPVYLDGKVYLAGPYKGAPLSLAVITPAVSGPYDLGNVVVRAAIDVDPTDAHITTVSDSLPSIIDGIPLRLRQIRVNLDREGFALNPTNCDPFQVSAAIFGDQGAEVDRDYHYQMADCDSLDFSPKLNLRLKGPTTRNGHPAVHATLDYTAGQANIKRVAVTLPHTEQLDTFHIGSACTTPQFDAGQCPDNSLLGTAEATTPLLDQPLEGNVYLVTAGNPLPDIVLALRGQIDLNVHGVVDTAPSGGLRTTFNTVPDAPISSFRLDLAGGKKGLVVNNTDTCKHVLRAVAKIAGQNGKSANRRVSLNASCGSARHKRHRRHLQRARAVR
jgi:hypothetical protein